LSITTETDPVQKERDSQIIEAFKDKKSRYQDYWDPIYKETERHAKFTMMGEQLDDGELKRYGLKYPLMPNLLITYANHEANKTLQTDYRGKITPNGGNANEITARARQDAIRGLMRTQSIEQIFNQVRRLQVCGGIAYSIAEVGYAGKRGYGKTLKDRFLPDYQNVFPDITVESTTFSDMRDCLIKQEVPKIQWEEMTGQKAEDADWRGKKTKEIWHYWVREDIKDRELLKEDNTTVMASTLGEKPDYTGFQLDESGEPLDRPTEDYSWCWYKIINDDEIIDEEPWLGSYPPIVACTGRKVSSKDKTYFQPLTQFAEEPQKLYTILENIIALRLSKSPFSKWKVAFESIPIKEMVELRKAAIVGDTDIIYKSLTADGKPIAPPEEIEPHILDAILITLQQEQQRKIQQIFGIFDANLGNKSNEQSGVAIRERAQGGELSNFDLQFNYMEYVEQVTRVKLDLIPKYLTAPQQMAFVDEDDNTVMQWINTTGGISFSPDEEYSLSVEAMPISQTAREDEAEALMNMAKVMPIIAQNPQAVALIVKAQPGRYAGQISEFIAKGDPQIAEAQKVIGELQGQLQQAEMKMQQGEMKLQQVTQQAQAKQAQDQMTIAGLKQAVQGMKAQQTMFKQMQAIEGQSAEMQKAMEDTAAMTEAQIKAAELEIARFEAETGAENDRIKADAAMIIAVDKASRPDPAPKPAPGAAA
jgi:hypothetical protein